MRSTRASNRLGHRPTWAVIAGVALGSLGVVVACTTAADGPGTGEVPTVGVDASILDATTSRDSAIVIHHPLPNLAPDATPADSFCALPGSVVWTDQGPAMSAGSTAAPPDLSWLTVPVGFCVHAYAAVPEVRQLRVAPNGDVFAASPSQPTTGGAAGGLGTIVVLPDDDHDGVPEATRTFLSSLPRVQGMTFNGGYFYFQNDVTIQRVAYQTGDRSPRGPIENVTTITAQQATEHWPKVFDFDRRGNFYVTNGSTQGELCYTSAAPRGAVFKIDPRGTPNLVAKGFRNPIAMRCETDHDVCLVAELAKDGSGGSGGREKLVPVRQGDDWGFPCCATKDVPYGGVEYQDNGLAPNCSGVTAEDVSFTIGHTPFGLDFEPGVWPAPWTSRVFVALHGDVGTWFGARVVGIALDPATGLPLSATELGASSVASQSLLDFATGWDDGAKNEFGRPAALAFAPDGRMFLANDTNGQIVWISPLALTRHPVGG